MSSLQPSQKLPLDSKTLWWSVMNHPDFRKLKPLFAPLLGRSIWWIVEVRVLPGKKILTSDAGMHLGWVDSESAGFNGKKSLFDEIARKRNQQGPFEILNKKTGALTHCIPLASFRRQNYILAVRVTHQDFEIKNVLNLLNHTVRVMLSGVYQSAELTKLSESIRPRMVALSTVHTVHRLINTTLNLEELFERLARLTCQVLRVKKCSIFMYENSSHRAKQLIERGRATLSKNNKYVRRKIRSGEGLEGKVWATAKHVLRKDLLCIPMIDEDVVGVITLRIKKDGTPFNMFDQEILMTLSEEAVVAIKNARLYEEQKRVTFETVHSLAGILGTRFSPHRKIKMKTLLDITFMMIRLLKLNEEEKEAIHYATLLKDTSKFALPDDILKKSAKLTGEEYRLVQQHPLQGAKMLQSFTSLKPVAPIVLALHEKYDGSGYPYGLKGKDIPVGARILAVIQAFEVLVGGRPYKQGISLEETLEELKRNRGTQFDPVIVDVFCRVMASTRIQSLLKKDLQA